MKKLLLVLILVNSFSVLSYSVRQDETGIYYSVKNSGFYGVYVKGMPFWKFWSYPKALRSLADKTKNTIELTQLYIKYEIPVFYTRNYQEAEQLKTELLCVDCELEIRELAFTCKTEEEAKEIETRLELMRLTPQSFNGPDVKKIGIGLELIK